MNLTFSSLSRAILCWLLLVNFPVGAATLTGHVVGVADGNTITVLDARKAQHKVRLLGIAAPALRQPYGERARQQLSSLVYRQVVRVEWERRDRYGRMLGLVYAYPKAPTPEDHEACAEGRGCQTEANLLMVGLGYAWVDGQSDWGQSAEERELYAEAQGRARRLHKGLWADENAVPPWERAEEHR